MVHTLRLMLTYGIRCLCDSSFNLNYMCALHRDEGIGSCNEPGCEATLGGESAIEDHRAAGRTISPAQQGGRPICIL